MSAESARKTASNAGIGPAHNAAPSTPRASRDFFLELVTTSQSRPGFLAERERWLRSLTLDGREELLFEFEMLLRGIERYFNLHNLPIDPHAPVVTRDFRAEMEDVRDAIEQAIKLGRTLLDPTTDQKLVFRRYIESRLADDRSRRALLEEELSGQTPQESLFLLRLSLDALRTIVDHLLKLEVVSFGLFNEVGTLALREIVLNPYFRPFGPLEFRIEYDRIKSVALLEALRALPDPERGLFTTAVLAVFRVLHYLSYVGGENRAPEPRARVILALVRSESVTLANYLKDDVAAKAQSKRHKAYALRISRDVMRAQEQIARDYLSVDDGRPQGPLDAAVAFTELFRTTLVHLSRGVFAKFPPTLQFHQLISATKMAERLRKDLWAMVELCQRAETLFRDREQRAAADSALSGLRAFLAYFQGVSYHLLRYGDFEAFDRFTAIVTELDHTPEGPTARARFADDCRLFAQIAHTTLAGVSRRADLSGKAFDTSDAEALVAKYLDG